MKEEDINNLKQLLEKLKEKTEQFVEHDKLVQYSEKYMLIIAMEKYIERYG